ncbi:hypothetical protein MMC18_008271 [Xylographa bjoerkii]|nr:hypothetical protein [Xylographa bjoerkii]
MYEEEGSADDEASCSDEGGLDDKAPADSQALSSKEATSDEESILSLDSLGSTIAIASSSQQSSLTIVFGESAKHELLLVFTKDDVLQTLYADALQKRGLSRTRFERNFQRLIKRYCSELHSHAQSAPNNKVVSFIREQRRWIAREISKQFVVIDEFQRLRMADLTMQKSQKLMLERSLAHPSSIPNQPTFKNVTDIGFDRYSASDSSKGSSESEFDDSTDYSEFPNIEQIRNFLIHGEPFENLRTNLRLFIYPPASVPIFQFQLMPKTYVDGLELGRLPPAGSVDYEFYTVESRPPVPPKWLIHVFKHPEYGSEVTLCLNRFPKKKKEQLYYTDHQETVGWGIYFSEGPHVAMIATIMFLFAVLAGLVFGICWTFMNHDIQGAWTVAAWISSVGALGFAAWTAWATLD